MNVTEWGCMYEQVGFCVRVLNLPCRPGMKGCLLSKRFRFSSTDENYFSNIEQQKTEIKVNRTDAS